MVRSAPLARRLRLICALILVLALGACARESEDAAGSPPAVVGIPGEAERSPNLQPDPLPAPTRAPFSAPIPAEDQDRHAVRINGEWIPDERIVALEREYGVQILDGEYWYDAASGAAGLIGGPTLGFVLPGLALGGPLAADASGGRTGVLVNGRELPAAELAALVPLVGVLEPGRYFVDGAGNAGREGEAPTVNLLELVRRAGASGGDGGWYSQASDAGGNESGGSGYVMGRDGSGNVWSVSY